MSWEVHPSYRELRRSAFSSCLLNEDRSGTPPERLLQAVWFHQRLRREGLVGTDGRSVQILHPGFWNREAGPDFRKAVVRWEGEAPLQGDVEIDLHSRGWKAHGHLDNPAYCKVVLHVVWETEAEPRFPTVVLKHQLDAPIEELAQWHGAIPGGSWPPPLAGQCRMPLQHLAPDTQARLILDAAETRLQQKADRLTHQARSQGWEIPLWSVVFRALGYKQNPWPMQKLGELGLKMKEGCDSVGSLQARLLGVSGLLPHELTSRSPEAQQQFRHYWDCWWRDRDSWEEWTLPRSAWNLSNLRPNNHPQRRLALAAHWLHDPAFSRRLEQWGCDGHPQPRELLPSLLEALQPPKDPFWNHHWTLRSSRTDRPLSLIGRARMTDLAVNAILPWILARAGEKPLPEVCKETRRRFLEWPSTQDNAVLRQARHRLLSGEASKPLLKTAAAQQGLLQIVGDFCERSDSLCSHCPFPDFVRGQGEV